jgi:hypothetical protein
VKPFSDAMVKAEKGKFTPQPVQTQFGWHVILVEDTRDAKVPGFDEVKPQLAQRMQAQHPRQVLPRTADEERAVRRPLRTRRAGRKRPALFLWTRFLTAASRVTASWYLRSDAGPAPMAHAGPTRARPQRPFGGGMALIRNPKEFGSGVPVSRPSASPRSASARLTRRHRRAHGPGYFPRALWDHPDRARRDPGPRRLPQARRGRSR